MNDLNDPDSRSKPSGSSDASGGFWRGVVEQHADRPLLSSKQAVSALAAVLGLYACYGLAAGFFQGGQQLLVSAFKVPLVLSATLLLCVPSLFVLAVLGGAQLTVKAFLTAVLEFAGRLGLLAVAILPIVWLFSVSTQYLFVIIMMHVIGLVFALGLARRALTAPGRAASGLVTLWLCLVLVVALQVATVCRPILLTPEGGALFDGGKLFFIEHFDRAADQKSP